ncbi:MAG: hypothetical protein RR719_02805 [Akkermansia sp.]
MEEEKEYLPADPTKGNFYKNIREAVADVISDEHWEEIEQLAKTMTCATRLTEMRIKSGISQCIMAAALNCRQPRISEIESTPNARMSMSSILKYVEVTKIPFEAELEDGRIIIVRMPRKKRKSPSRSQPPEKAAY